MLATFVEGPLDPDTTTLEILNPRDLEPHQWREGLGSILETLLENRTSIEASLPFSGYQFERTRTVEQICALLTAQGEHGLASRIAYFASNEDLEEDEVPVTAGSARGFLAFFSEVESDGKVGLACSQEGWICAEWRFSDRRRASLWFLDEDRVMFAATDNSGDFIEIEGVNEIGYRSIIVAKLVEAGLLKWSPSNVTSTSFRPTKMLPDIADLATSTSMGYSPPTPSFSETKNPTYPPIGWNTFTHQTVPSKSPQFVVL
jgi:hypothetical protein